MLLTNLLAKSTAPPAKLACEVLVIGGGSGGLACAQAVSKLLGVGSSSKVILLDHVRPADNTGTVWGLGGTCVNVGCVPKKLFHRSGHIGQVLMNEGEAHAYGYTTPQVAADWPRVRSMVQNHIRMLNFTYRSGLPANCEYINSAANFSSASSGQITINNGKTVIEPSKAVVVAVGGRPVAPVGLPGSELGISSDDVFSLAQSPGKTLVVGASYIGLETASFLAGMGLDCTLLVRSEPLRAVAGFDSQCAEKVLRLMQQEQPNNLVVRRHCELVALERTSTAGILAKMSGKEEEQVFDTVLFAMGRRPETERLFSSASSGGVVSIDQSTGKIKVDPDTFVAGKVSGVPVYAIGDCAETGSPELTPVAIRQAELVAERIAGGGAFNKKRHEALQFVPSSVFALPSEYSCVGLSEREAVGKFGADAVEVYLREWEPLETGVVMAHAAQEEPRCLVKMVCVKSTKEDEERVVGLHLVSPTSSEAIHGLALSVALGATKQDFDSRVLGIHPTDGEALCDVTVTKRSGLDFRVASGCGGGKCG